MHGPPPDVAADVADRVWQHGKRLGFKRKGRLLYKENINEDLVELYFRPMRLRGGAVQFRTTMSLNQGITRRLDFDMEAKRLPIHFVDQCNDWYWAPDVPDLYALADARQVWSDITIPGAPEALEHEAVSRWLPTMDELIQPGILSAELQEETGRFPGEFIRSSVGLALSLLNDRPKEQKERNRLLVVVERTRPDIARKIARRYG